MQADDFSSIEIQHLFDLTNWQDKYRLIIDWSDCVKAKPELQKPDYALVGCEVQTWIHRDLVDDSYYFYFDSQSKLIKGLAALILSQVNGQTAEVIRHWDWQVLMEKTQLQKHITPSRSNGLLSIIQFCQNI